MRVVTGGMCAFVAASAMAFEPPRVTVEAALRDASVVLIGRVIETREVSYGDHRATGVAKILPLSHLIGTPCKLKTTELSYVVFDHGVNENGAQFKIGTFYLISLRHASTSKCRLEFRSAWGPATIDYAFEMGERPTHDKKVAMVSIWGRAASDLEALTLAEIESLVRARPPGLKPEPEKLK